MRISTELIKSFNPCQDRLDNWLKHYSNFKGNLKQFFKLEHITHHDKLWVALRIASNDTKVIFAIDCSLSATAATAAAHYAATDSADAARYAAADSVDAAAHYAAATAAYADAAYYATDYATAAYYAAATADAARYAAAYAADVAANKEVEEQRQLASLLYLIERE